MFIFWTAGKLGRTNMCVIVQNFTKIDQKVLEISQFFHFQDGRRPPSWILKVLNFWSNVRLGGLIRIAMPNFTKIGQTVAEISQLTIFKMAAVHHLRLLNVWYFDQLVSSGGVICAIMQNFLVETVRHARDLPDVYVSCGGMALWAGRPLILTSMPSSCLKVVWYSHVHCTANVRVLTL